MRRADGTRRKVDQWTRKHETIKMNLDRLSETTRLESVKHMAGLGRSLKIILSRLNCERQCAEKWCKRSKLQFCGDMVKKHK